MFGLSEGCLIKVTEYIMDLLVEKSKVLIKWPSKDEYAEIAAAFCCNIDQNDTLEVS